MTAKTSRPFVVERKRRPACFPFYHGILPTLSAFALSLLVFSEKILSIDGDFWNWWNLSIVCPTIPIVVAMAAMHFKLPYPVFYVVCVVIGWLIALRVFVVIPGVWRDLRRDCGENGNNNQPFYEEDILMSRIFHIDNECHFDRACLILHTVILVALSMNLAQFWSMGIEEENKSIEENGPVVDDDITTPYDEVHPVHAWGKTVAAFLI